MVAFTAAQDGRRQIFVRFLKGGQPLPVTNDDADHQLPRWSPDGSSLVYFSPAAPGEVQGAIYRIPTLGGSFQRVIASIGGGDVSRSGRLACFRLEDKRSSWSRPLSMARMSNVVRRSRRSTIGIRGGHPTTSGSRSRRVTVSGGTSTSCRPRRRETGTAHRTTTDSSRVWRGFLTAAGSCLPRAAAPPFRICRRWRCGRCCWTAGGRRGNSRRPKRPTSNPTCTTAASCLSPAMQMRFDIWKYPFGGVAADNVRRAAAGDASDGTGADPDGRAGRRSDRLSLRQRRPRQHLGDVDGTGQPRQITFEDDPTVAIGVPIWSPDGRWIAFVSSKGNSGFAFGVWLVRPDGSELHQLVPKGLGVAWSSTASDSTTSRTHHGPMKKIAVSGGEPVTVRSEPVRNMIGVHGPRRCTSSSSAH